jgi:hypothetical protein
LHKTHISVRDQRPDLDMAVDRHDSQQRLRRRDDTADHVCTASSGSVILSMREQVRAGVGSRNLAAIPRDALSIDKHGTLPPLGAVTAWMTNLHA